MLHVIHGLIWVSEFTLIFIFGNVISLRFPNKCKNVYKLHSDV